MTDVRRALRLREKWGHPQAFADSAKYDCLFKDPFHSRLAPHITLFFVLFFLPLWVCLCVVVRGIEESVCIVNSLCFFFSIFLFSNGRKVEGVKAWGAEYHQLLRLVNVKGAENLVEECIGNALLLNMDEPTCCRFCQDSLVIALISILMLPYGQQLVKVNWLEDKSCGTKTKVQCNQVLTDQLQDFRSDFGSRDCSLLVVLFCLWD